MLRGGLNVTLELLRKCGSRDVAPLVPRYVNNELLGRVTFMSWIRCSYSLE